MQTAMLSMLTSCGDMQSVWSGMPKESNAAHLHRRHVKQVFGCRNANGVHQAAVRALLRRSCRLPELLQLDVLLHEPLNVSVLGRRHRLELLLKATVKAVLRPGNEEVAAEDAYGPYIIVVATG